MTYFPKKMSSGFPSDVLQLLCLNPVIHWGSWRQHVGCLQTKAAAAAPGSCWGQLRIASVWCNLPGVYLSFGSFFQSQENNMIMISSAEELLSCLRVTVTLSFTGTSSDKRRDRRTDRRGRGSTEQRGQRKQQLLNSWQKTFKTVYGCFKWGYVNSLLDVI